ncbi:hypothetical protein FBU30_008671, partial [Linnemannia zychae]
MDADIELHEYNQIAGNGVEEDIDQKPVEEDEIAYAIDDDDDILQILGLANQIFLFGNQLLLQGGSRINPVIPNIVFNLDLYDEAKSLMEFRFHIDEIYNIGAALRLPQIMILDNDMQFQTIEGLYIVLHRLAYPCR